MGKLSVLQAPEAELELLWRKNLLIRGASLLPGTSTSKEMKLLSKKSGKINNNQQIAHFSLEKTAEKRTVSNAT